MISCVPDSSSVMIGTSSFLISRNCTHDSDSNRDCGFIPAPTNWMIVWYGNGGRDRTCLHSGLWAQWVPRTLPRDRSELSYSQHAGSFRHTVSRRKLDVSVLVALPPSVILVRGVCLVLSVFVAVYNDFRLLEPVCDICVSSGFFNSLYRLFLSIWYFASFLHLELYEYDLMSEDYHEIRHTWTDSVSFHFLFYFPAFLELSRCWSTEPQYFSLTF